MASLMSVGASFAMSQLLDRRAKEVTGKESSFGKLIALECFSVFWQPLISTRLQQGEAGVRDRKRFQPFPTESAKPSR